MLHEKNVTEFKTLKIAFGLSFFNLCVGRLLVQTTRFVVKYLQKPLTCKAETCSTVHKVSLHDKLFMLPARGTCANGIFTSPPYQDNFSQGLDQRLK